MTAISVTSQIATGNSREEPLSAVDGKKSSVSKERMAEIKKVAVEFQSIFVEMMLKSMRQTTKQDNLTGGGCGEDVYNSLLDREYASAISRRGNLGLAEMMEKQLLAQETGSHKAGNSQKNTKPDVSEIEASHENRQ